ncbi:protein yippee-like protein isoform X1 [Cinnamomum micranthum f. kanehirae]|uniref:Protein yippee-like protein isoform X1 n=1 Tax=Cinnamomum micranthum f. kanehirae TaxID=337451 RepID=A0A3S3PPA4_9MAGN|nr:protein yippee-like protein isoform X1 [Cinnamomum micranthum f. kanehirae]
MPSTKKITLKSSDGKWWSFGFSNAGVLVSPMPKLVGPQLYSYCNCRNHVALHDEGCSPT